MFKQSFFSVQIFQYLQRVLVWQFHIFQVRGRSFWSALCPIFFLQVTALEENIYFLFWSVPFFLWQEKNTLWSYHFRPCQHGWSALDPIIFPQCFEKKKIPLSLSHLVNTVPSLPLYIMLWKVSQSSSLDVKVVSFWMKWKLPPTPVGGVFEVGTPFKFEQKAQICPPAVATRRILLFPCLKLFIWELESLKEWDFTFTIGCGREQYAQVSWCLRRRKITNIF